MPYLEDFHETYPKVKVSVSNAPTPETMKSLYDGKIDFGIVSTPVTTHGDVKLIHVQKIRNVFVAGEKFLSLKGKTLQYKELEKSSLYTSGN